MARTAAVTLLFPRKERPARPEQEMLLMERSTAASSAVPANQPAPVADAVILRREKIEGLEILHDLAIDALGADQRVIHLCHSGQLAALR